MVIVTVKQFGASR